MPSPLDAAALDTLFRQARTHNAFSDREVTDETLRELYDLAKMGPTAFNTTPARFVFLKSPEAKARLAPHLSSANRAKPLGGGVQVIVAFDLGFADRLAELAPHNPGVAAFFDDPAVAHATAFRNGSLQGAYLIIAARALGLDAGPMSGFNPAGVDEAFFSGTTWKTNFLCNLGYGSGENLRERAPRLAFEDACQVL